METTSTTKVICECGKEFKDEHYFKIHWRYCNLNPNKKDTYELRQKEFQCKYCGKTFKGTNGISRHEKYCKNNPDKIAYKNKINSQKSDEPRFCQYCGKECKNLNSLSNHERLCKLNPNRQLTKYEKYGRIAGFNAFGREAWNKGLTKETDERVNVSAETLHQKYVTGELVGTALGRIVKPESINKMLATREQRGRKGGRYLNGYYKGIECDSGWELAFILYNELLGNEVMRCIESFPYNVDEVIHQYRPDFIINDVYYEIKGQDLFHTQEKINQFPKNKTLIVLREKEMRPIIKKVIEVYGKEFARMYDRSKPSWMDFQNLD